MGPAVGIFGISGVGKTYLCKQILLRDSSVLHLEAGALLRRATNQNNEQLRTADEQTISRNQKLLANEMLAERSRTLHSAVILDAHSIVDNGVGVVKISPDAIAPLLLTKIIFVHDNPEVILDRRSQDKRIRPQRSVEELRNHQSQAEDNCLYISDTLRVPFLKFSVGNVDDIYLEVIKQQA